MNILHVPNKTGCAMQHVNVIAKRVTISSVNIAQYINLFYEFHVRKCVSNLPIIIFYVGVAFMYSQG